MSEFNHFAQELNAIAQDSFAQYTQAATALEAAKTELNRFPAGAQTPEALMAQANFYSARDELRATQRRMADRLQDVKKLRSELAAAVESAFCANPADLDLSTLELLKSGVLKPDEYGVLMEKAASPTMRRVIGRYAETAADAREKRFGAADGDVKRLRLVAHEGAQNPGDSILGNFDMLADAFTRSTKNPGLIDHWNDLCSETVENF